MNQLTRFLLKETLGEQKIIAIYGGGFKPPHKGHFNVVKQILEQFPETDELKIFVGSGVRDNLTQEESLKIWEIYKPYLSNKVSIEPTQSPIKSILDYSKKHPSEKIYFILGAREGQDSDIQDIQNRTKTLDKYPNIEVKIITSAGGISGTKARQLIKSNNKDAFFQILPDIKEKEQVWNIVNKNQMEILKEGRYDNTVRNLVKDTISYWKQNYKPTSKKIPYVEDYDIEDAVDFPIKFDLDAVLHIKKTPSRFYDVDGGAYPYEKIPVISIDITVDPRDLPQKWEKIYIDLTDTIRHELEHLTQHGTAVIPSKEMGDDTELRTKVKTDFEYINLPTEVDANLQGLYIRAKKTRTPFKQVVSDYLDELGLTKKEKKETLNIWKQRAKALSLPLNESSKDYFGLNEYTKTFINEIFNNQKIDDDFKTHLKSLVKYMLKSGLNIKPLPKLNIISNDKQNASNILGKTAYYNPEDKSITLYTFGRHPKDVMRSFCHEMIHYIQDLESRLNNITTQNTNEDGNLPEIEREAYEKGNMIFRNWEDSVKEQKYLKEYKQYVLNELFEKDLPNIEQISPLEYIVGNGNDIEAKYYFRLDEPDSNKWSIHWKFTENNKNTSPETWKQVTTTSFKVLKDFIDNKKPTYISISGNESKSGRNAKLNIYKSKSFLEKLENIFNNQYLIKNDNEDFVLMKSIEEAYKYSINESIKHGGEKYEDALYYWQNLDINSKSKIERWSAIKRKVQREVLQEVYKFKLTTNYKQLKEEEQTLDEPIQQYKIYLDMDGCITNFDKRFKDLNPEKLSSSQYQTKYGLDKFWEFIDKDNKVKFWVGMSWMPDGKQLWDYIKKYEPTILSAPSRDPSSRLGKRLWIKNNIPGTPLILAAANKKQNYSRKNSILIDDRPDNIEQWRSQGGKGILHVNTEDTIKQLQAYGL